MNRTRISILLAGSLPCFGGTIGILADPAVNFPPTSTTGYPLAWLGDALYGQHENVSQVSIDGKLYLAVETDEMAPILPPVIPDPPHVPVGPLDPPHHHDDWHDPHDPPPGPENHVPEPGTFASGLAVLLLLWRRR